MKRIRDIKSIKEILEELGSYDDTRLVITRNAIRCNYCGDVIESHHVHEMVTCSCGNVSVDGGKEYLRRCYRFSKEDYTDLSEGYFC